MTFKAAACQSWDIYFLSILHSVVKLVMLALDVWQGKEGAGRAARRRHGKAAKDDRGAGKEGARFSGGEE
jgi:hypothetical protein